MERRSTTHNPRLDDEMEREDRAFLQGHPSPAHVEEWLQTEGFPDDTDSDEVDEAARMEGGFRDDTIAFEEDEADDD